MEQEIISLFWKSKVWLHNKKKTTIYQKSERDVWDLNASSAPHISDGSNFFKFMVVFIIIFGSAYEITFMLEDLSSL